MFGAADWISDCCTLFCVFSFLVPLSALCSTLTQGVEREVRYMLYVFIFLLKKRKKTKRQRLENKRRYCRAEQIESPPEHHTYHRAFRVRGQIYVIHIQTARQNDAEAGNVIQRDTTTISNYQPSMSFQFSLNLAMLESRV